MTVPQKTYKFFEAATHFWCAHIKNSFFLLASRVKKNHFSRQDGYKTCMRPVLRFRARFRTQNESVSRSKKKNVLKAWNAFEGVFFFTATRFRRRRRRENRKGV